jgi:hypothetical protein
MQNFNIGLAVIIFIAYAVVDAAYAYYTLSVTRLKPYTAASVGAGMHFILAFGVINYVHNYFYIIPLALGSWVGTFLLVKREKSNLSLKKASDNL